VNPAILEELEECYALPGLFSVKRFPFLSQNMTKGQPSVDGWPCDVL
jgi:hypothetical protein